MSTPRIAIVSPNRDAWSETFIAAHIQRLPGVELVLTDGHLPKRFADGRLLLEAGFTQRLMRRFTGATLDDLLRHRIASLLRSHRIDLVLAEYGPTGEAMLDVCERAGVPMAVHFHGIDAFHEKLLRENDGYRRSLHKAAAVVAVSREMEAQLLALGAPRERTHYNCYGIDVDRFAPADPSAAPPRFFAVGRFADTKAPFLTLLAFERALREVPEARLTMAGQGVLLETCVTMANALRIEHAVEFPGVLAHDRVAGAMRASRAFVQHSVITSYGDREGTPLAVLEAMASALPVIATRHAGIADVVRDGHSGLLLDERDVEAMARHMVALARDPMRARALGLAGRAHVLAHHRVEERIAALRALLAAALR